MGKRLHELDSFKAIACLMVILIHVTASPVTYLEMTPGVMVLTVINRFCKPSVPMFIFASGFALSYSYRTKKFSYGEFLGRRLLRVLVPYVFWCAVYYAWFIANGVYEFDPGFFIVNLFTGKMIYHLYFVVDIVQFYVLFPVFRWITENVSYKIGLPAAFIINAVVIMFIPELYYGRCFATYLACFMLGCYMAKVRKEKPIRLILIGAGILYVLALIEYTLLFLHRIPVPFFGDRMAFLEISVVASLFVYELCLLIKSKVIEEVGRASFYIYLSHPLFLLIAGVIAYNHGYSLIGEMWLAIGLTLICSVPGSLIYQKLRIGIKKA